MTQEEKAKAYDKVREKIALRFGSNVAEEIFSQFEMSEDERIRKALINGFNKLDKSAVWYNGITNGQILAWLEKQGEQKPNDKVEPKFKVGDWVIGRVTENEPRQIAEITEEGYKTTYGGWIGFSFEEDMRLWTIQDAKDGDVLIASDGSIFLFKNTIDCACKHYVALTTDGVIKFNEGLEHYWETSRAVQPSTKEQRDTLLKAMTDAGYTFDFEKKELKKIESKPAEWSEEDEEMLEDIRFNFEYNKEKMTDGLVEQYDKFFDKVKSLKPQPKQDWSEEDEQYLLICKNALAKYQVSDKWDAVIISQWLESRLSSLRPQNRWKPSEEQMHYLHWIANVKLGDSVVEQEVSKHLNELYEDLKKLREE